MLKNETIAHLGKGRNNQLNEDIDILHTPDRQDTYTRQTNYFKGFLACFVSMKFENKRLFFSDPY